MSKKTGKQIAESKKKFEDTIRLHSWFQELWDRMPRESRKCRSCGCSIKGPNKSYYWDHLLEKSKHPDLAMLEWNIFFCCQECHEKKTNGFPTKEHAKAIEMAQEQFRLFQEGLLIYEKMLKT